MTARVLRRFSPEVSFTPVGARRPKRGKEWGPCAHLLEDGLLGSHAPICFALLFRLGGSEMLLAPLLNP